METNSFGEVPSVLCVCLIRVSLVKSLFSIDMLLKARVNLSKQCFARLTLKNRFPQLGYAPTISNVQNVLEIFRSVGVSQTCEWLS